MRFIVCADLHIRSNRPQFRTDDYFKTVCFKFKQIINYAKKYKAQVIIAGDMFDNVKVGHKVVNAILDMIDDVQIFGVLGQHDMSFHTQQLEHTPIQTLIHAGKFNLLKNNQITTFDSGIQLFGCSFGETPIKVKPNPRDYNDSYPENAKILVIHHPITPDQPPFFLEDAIEAQEMLDKYSGYRYIISGDYHVPFVNEYKGRTLINCGPMMRQSIDQVDLHPRVYLVDTVKEKVKPLYLPIEAGQNVFALEQARKAEESKFSQELSDLVESLKDQSKRPDFKQTVQLLMKEVKYPKTVRNKVNSILEEL